MPIYDYICEAGHKAESRRGFEVENIPCPFCGRQARRVPVSQGQNVMHSRQGQIGGAYRRYQEASADINYACNKFESETNATVPSLGLWEQAKREARRRL